MRLEAGQKMIGINLPAIDGSNFSSESVKGKKILLSFYRFASCPFCNLRIHEMVKRHAELGEDFVVIAIFDSPLDNLIKHSEGHKAPFPILADEANVYYRKYGIEHSFMGMMKGMMLRMPTMIKGMFKGYVPLVIKGSMTTMPADFLIDKEGKIQVAYYGKDEGDHLDFEDIKAFALAK